MTFSTWEAAHAYAQREADARQCSFGIEFSKYDRRWIVRGIPRADKRFGVDARCEAVEPGRGSR